MNWDSVSEEAIRFTQLCMTMDYRVRPSASTLAQNPWCSRHHFAKSLTQNTTKILRRRLSRAPSSGLSKTSMIAVAFTMPPQKARELRILFQQIDQDGSGQVDKEEFRLAFKTTESGLNDVAIDSLFGAIDQDGNGQISFLEFVAAMIDPKEVDIQEINQVWNSICSVLCTFDAVAVP